MKHKPNGFIKTISKEVGPHINSGESIVIETDIIDNGDNEPDKSSRFLNQRITLQSYGNSASINLFGASMTPKFLRELANEIESAMNSN